MARVDREITAGYERQAVITFAAALLGRAGLWADSDTLLKSNLARSHSPYYLMSQLGSNARRLGRTDEALNWFAQSFDTVSYTHLDVYKRQVLPRAQGSGGGDQGPGGVLEGCAGRRRGRCRLKHCRPATAGG